MKTINIKNCEGYIWWSDQQAPKVYPNSPLDISLDETKNPFIVEGLLYDKDNKKSYSIKYVDGQYLTKEYNVEEQDFANPDNEQKSFLSNRMDGRWLKFLRYWEEEKDENCMAMHVLTLTKNVFVGFNEKEDLSC